MKSFTDIIARFVTPIMLLLPMAALAQKIDFQVVVEAPANVKAVIVDNLALIKLRNNERIDIAQLKRLFEEAKSEIETLVSTEGYFAPAIDATLENDGELWVARFKVETGTPVHVTDLQLSFAGAIGTSPKGEAPTTDELLAGWLMPRGEIFKQAIWEAAKRKLLQQMIVYRYPQAIIVDSRAEVDVQSGEVALKVAIDSGLAVSFGALTVTGLKRYPLQLITNLNPLAPGEPYNQALLLELQRRLQDTGYFLRVDVSAEVDAASAGGTAPVLVSVEENTLQRIGLGAGYSTNTGSRAQVSYERLNLFGSGVRMKSLATVETKKQTALVDFLFPATAQGKRDSVTTYFKREDVQNETTRTSGISTTRAWGEPQLERGVTLAYGRERRDVLVGATLNDGRAADATLGAPHDATTTNSSSSQTLSANYSVTMRRADNLLSPSKGFLVNLQAGAAPSKFLTTTPFARVYGKYAHYFPLSAHHTLIVRAEAGIVAAKGRAGIPADFLFRAGGDQSIRGYGYQQLGVREGSAVVGGRYLAVGSAELVHWLTAHSAKWANWGVAAFVDGGNAADRPADLKPVYGYGAGARWKSPVGVINLDIAYGQAVRQARLHFSLGVTF